MHFSSPLRPARLLRRYKRFLADVQLDGDPAEDPKKDDDQRETFEREGYPRCVTVACPNTGSMLGLSTPGLRIWLSHATNPKRRTAYTWELTELEPTELPSSDSKPPPLIGINPQHPNTLVFEALKEGFFSALLGPDMIPSETRHVRREVPYGNNSRIDFFLDGSGHRPCFLEVKNVHLSRKPGMAEFPDSKTTRGARHLRDLAQEVRHGARSLLVYVVQREDCTHLSLANDIDPEYAKAAQEALDAGVECVACSCSISLTQIHLARVLPILSLSNLSL